MSIQKQTIIGWLSILFLITACGDPNLRPETQYKAVLMKREDLEASVQLKPPRDYSKPGKIYYIHPYILINDLYKGIHIIDNNNSKSPVKVAFLQIPGCVDMAVKGNILYADNATDLVAVAFKSATDASVVKRLKEQLPEPLPPDGGTVPDIYSKSKRPANTVIIAWELKN